MGDPIPKLKIDDYVWEIAAGGEKGSRPVPAEPAAAGQQTDDSQQPTETLKVNVNVVSLFFNVKDKHGALIPNLTKDDFEIAEDSKPQTIKYFTAESNLPLTLGILIDSSGSQLRVLDMEKEVGGAFLHQIITDKDEAFVIDFNIDAELVQDFTRDVHRLQNALNKVKINSGVTMPTLPGAGGGQVPAYVGILEVPEENWGMYGQQVHLAAMQVKA